MRSIAFHKMAASGNDFIVVDNRKRVVRNANRFASDACRPHAGVGADGVLLIETSRKADFFMRILNSDGSEAEACGNGYRCVSLYARNMLGLSKRVRFETLSGTVETELVSLNGKRARVRVKMARPTRYEAGVSFTVNRRVLKGAFIDTGVPHVVMFTDRLDQVAVTKLGPAIRYHNRFKPRGTNVNFVEVTGPSALAIRTYERGVEDETLACGTGTVASAAVAHLTHRVQAPVQVKTKSGEVLTVSFGRSGNKIKSVCLEGGAEFVFEGRWMV